MQLGNKGAEQMHVYNFANQNFPPLMSRKRRGYRIKQAAVFKRSGFAERTDYNFMLAILIKLITSTEQNIS
jgi:hypothetical protein